MRRFLAVPFALLVLLVCSGVRAESLIERVPDDAMIYVAWKGADQLPASFDQSHLKAILDASEMRKLLTEFVPAALRKAAGENSDAGEAMDVLGALGQKAWRRECVFYLAGMDFQNPRYPMPLFAILCDAGADAPAMLDQANKMLAKAPGDFPFKAKVEGNIFVFGNIPTAGAKVEKSLVGKSEFATALQPEAVLYAYADFPAMLAVLDKALAEEAQAPSWARLLPEALGLKGLKQAAFSCGFDGKNWRTNLFIGAPEPRTGLISLLNGPPVSAEALKLVPKDAPFVIGATFDAGALVKEIRASLNRVDPNVAGLFDKAMGAGSMMVGTNIQSELIEVLGDQWVGYFAPRVGGNDLLGGVLINTPKDAAKLEKSLARVEIAINNIIAANIREPDGPKIAFRSLDVDGTKVHYFAVPFVGPSWAIKDGKLYFALYPQVIAAAMRAGGQGSILDNDAFKQVQAKLGVPAGQASMVSFVDLPAMAPQSYGFMLAYTRILLGMGDLFGLPAPAMAIPPLDKILPELEPAGSAGWLDASGFHYASIEPFPGASGLVASPGQAMVTQNAMLISILLPSLNRARETANRVKCASNERQIGQAMLLYSNENRGKYPPDLGTLLKTQDITIEVFICPTGHTQIPNAIRNAPIDQQAEWVNQHSDYVYAGAGKTNSAGAEEIMLYEKQNNHGRDGMNMLYGDGHVEWNMLQGALQELRKQGLLGNDAVPGQRPPRQQRPMPRSRTP